MKLGVAVFLWATLAFASSQSGPHGGQVVHDPDTTNKFEVKIDPDNGKIQVYSLRPEIKQPKSMAITLFKDPDNAQTIELKAANPVVNAPPRFEGELGPNAGSYAGFELKFGLNMKSLRILPYIPYIPTRQK
ncbi:MAG: hypothetical protein HY075_04350 [Deltaproteobacteria bacterium]|nr:hypothetical protein [Deltaproteobacteria bacterium]